MEPFEVDGILYTPPAPNESHTGPSPCEYRPYTGNTLQIFLDRFHVDEVDLETYSKLSSPA